MLQRKGKDKVAKPGNTHTHKHTHTECTHTHTHTPCTHLFSHHISVCKIEKRTKWITSYDKVQRWNCETKLETKSIPVHFKINVVSPLLPLLPLSLPFLPPYIFISPFYANTLYSRPSTGELQVPPYQGEGGGGGQRQGA